MDKEIPRLTSGIADEVEKIIVGKRTQIRLMIMSILAEGHILLDDMPGVGKTTLVKTLSIALGCDFKRIQFTPDLLPSDITGMNIYNQKTGQFQLMQGPVMTHILLADEINRAIPRTQSALLEAMEERQVTIDGVTYPLPSPFVVMATQNPVETESTFHLPAAQMDRFLIRLSLGYPDAAEEKQMLTGLGDIIPFEGVKTVTGAGEIVAVRRDIQSVRIAEDVLTYIVALVQSTRSHPLIKMGASPRASRALYKASKAYAAMEGRDFVTPDDVQRIAPSVLCHRLVLSNEARLSGKSGADIVFKLMETLPVPPSRKDTFHE